MFGLKLNFYLFGLSDLLRFTCGIRAPPFIVFNFLTLKYNHFYLLLSFLPFSFPRHSPIRPINFSPTLCDHCLPIIMSLFLSTHHPYFHYLWHSYIMLFWYAVINLTYKTLYRFTLLLIIKHLLPPDKWLKYKQFFYFY